MKLQTYLHKKRISVSDAAEVLGYSRQRLYQVISGTHPPGRVLALRIVDWTNGKVDLKSLMEPANDKNAA